MLFIYIGFFANLCGSKHIYTSKNNIKNVFLFLKSVKICTKSWSPIGTVLEPVSNLKT